MSCLINPALIKQVVIDRSADESGYAIIIWVDDSTTRITEQTYNKLKEHLLEIE